MGMFHDGSRQIQQQFDSTKLADRIADRIVRTAFNDADKAFIESLSFFFLATAGPDGHPDCSFKGGSPGIARIMAPDLLVFPDFDGNGMFMSLGNIKANPHVGLLFIAMTEKPDRLRVNGRATVSFDDPLIGSFAGAQAIVRVTPEYVFPNCPRYIPNMKTGEVSVYTPCAGVAPVEPEWKSYEEIRDVVPPRKA